MLMSSYVAAAVLPFMLAGMLLVWSVSRSMEQDIGTRNLLITRSLAGEVEQFLRAKVGILEQVGGMLESGLLAEPAQVDTYLALVLEHCRYFERLEVMDLANIVRHTAPADTEMLGVNQAGTRMFTQARGMAGLHWSPVFVSAQSGQPTLSVAVAARSGMVVGYLRLAVLREMIEQVHQAGKGFAAILDIEGTAIAHRDEALVAQRENMGNEPFFKMVQSGRDGSWRQPLLGHEMLVSATTVPLTGWVVLVAQTEGDAFESVYDTAQIIVVGIAMAIGLGLGAALISLNKTLQPLFHLAAETRRIAGGDYRFQPMAASYCEVDELSAALSRMAETVEQRQAQLSRSEQRYRELFEESPIALCEEDFSGAKAYLDSLGCHSPERLREHIAAHPDLLVHCGRLIRVIRVNRSALELYEASGTDELLGTIANLMPEEARAILGPEFLSLMQRGRFDIETHNMTLKGRSIDVAVRGMLAPGHEQNWGRVVISIHDLTERNRSVRQRQQLERQLNQAQKMESLGTLAGGIAHDFNNLLMVIQGRATLMLMDLPESDPFCEHLHSIEANVRSAADLTRQLLGFARGGKYEVRPTDLNRLVKSTGTMFGRTRKQIRIHTVLQEGLWSAAVDRSQIEQVLLNLYVNADHAMPQGGQLTLSTANVSLAAGRAQRLDVAPGDYVSISVADTGTGIDDAIMGRIFEPFFTTKEKGRGTGLGLASSYGIARNHGGAIEVASRVGHGSTFELLLPAIAEVEAGETLASGRFSRAGRETILLVDDEQAILEVGRYLLESLGYRVLTADGGSAAIELYRREAQRIDLVILDMIMPDLSGGQVFDALLAITPRVQVLLSSGYSIEGQAAEILERGCKGFLQKPYDLATLSAKIREILDARTAQESIEVSATGSCSNDVMTAVGVVSG
jgi:signal transduction histidine kinase/ActR/RegA family two-component response regulator